MNQDENKAEVNTCTDEIDERINRLKNEQDNNNNTEQEEKFTVTKLLVGRLVKYSLIELLMLLICGVITSFIDGLTVRSFLLNIFFVNILIVPLVIIASFIFARRKDRGIEFKNKFTSVLDNIVIYTFTLFVIITNVVFLNGYVPSGSMENTILEGTHFVGNRLSYIFNEPQRYDIVAFRYPDNESDIYIKRIIGLPGETLTIKDGKVYVDGMDMPLRDDFILEDMETEDTLVYEIPDGCYFMLGDNRNDSNDSRYWKNTYVSGNDIIAKALFTYSPSIRLLK